MSDIREVRVSMGHDEIVVLYETLDGFFHGHVRTWVELKVSGKIGRKYIDTLEKAGLLEEAKQCVQKRVE